MTPISAVIISRNEEKNIARCIKSLEGIADEIIVVDSESTDKTAEICQSMGCRVVSRPFSGFGAQRQFATSLATNRYILSIDADEVLSPALRNSLINLKEKGLDHRVYRFSRMNFYCERPILHCGWYPDPQIRLFDKSYATWDLRDVFEKVIFPDSLQPRDVEGDILHYRCITSDEYHEKMMSHALIGANVIAATNSSVGLLTPTIKGLKSWLHYYIGKGGILDGAEGRAICREEYLATKKAYKTARQIIKDRKGK